MKKKFKKRYILFIVLGIFVIYNIIWMINFSYYNKMKKALGYHERYQRYVLVEDDFTYSVATPDYLSFTGNYAISQSVRPKVDEIVETVDMIIWPNLLKNKYEVGISFVKHNTYKVSENEIGTESTETRVLLDENMNPLDEESEYVLSKHPEYMERIKMMYQKAYDKWGILGVE